LEIASGVELIERSYVAYTVAKDIYRLKKKRRSGIQRIEIHCCTLELVSLPELMMTI